jgi:hypothetical protein
MALAQVQAAPSQPATALAAPATTGEGAQGVALLGNVLPTQAEPVPSKRPAHYLWAALIARIYEVFPLLCPICGGQMRLIAFITEGVQIRKIGSHRCRLRAPTLALPTVHFGGDSPRNDAVARTMSVST